MTQKRLSIATLVAVLLVGLVAAYGAFRPGPAISGFSPQGVSNMNSLHLAVATAQATGTPGLYVDNDSVARAIDVRNPAGTAVFAVDSDGAQTIAGAGDLTVGDTLDVDGDIDLDGDGFDVDVSAGASIDTGGATNLSASAGNITIDAETGSLALIGSEAAADAIHLDANDTVTSGLDIDVGSVNGLTIDGGLIDIGGGTCGVADGNDDVCIAGVLEVDGELELDGALDADSTADFAGAVTLAANVENVIAPSVATLAITYTAGAGGTDTLLTTGASEKFLILNCYANVTTDWDVTAGDDAHLEVGDDGDADGILDLDDAELQAADTDIANGPAGWQGYGADTIGAFMAAGAGYIIDGSDTVDVAWGATGDDLTAGELTLYLIYIRLE